MLKKLREYQERHIKEITAIMAEHEYRLKRYNRNVSVVLFFGDMRLNHEYVREKIRLTDRYISFEKDLSLLILSETDIKGGILAAEKILNIELNSNINKEIHTSVVEYNREQESLVFIHELFNILDFSLSFNHVNKILDSSFLESAY